MATVDGVVYAWRVLASVGLQKPSHWSQQEVIRDAIAVWCTLLQDVTDDQLLKLVSAYLRTPDVKFWPMPGKLLSFLEEVQNDQVDTADFAWGQVLAAIQQYGVSRLKLEDGEKRVHISPNGSDDQRIRRAIAAVGGVDAISKAGDDDMAIRSHFCAAYRSAKRQERVEREYEAISKALEERPEFQNVVALFDLKQRR